VPAAPGPGVYKRLGNGNLYLSVAKGDSFELENPEPVDGFALAGVK